MTDNADADLGVEVTLSGHKIRFYPLSWGAMRRTRAQRALIYGGAATPNSPEWEDAVLDVLYESATAPQTARGETPSFTKDQFAEWFNTGSMARCFRAMTRATKLAGEVAEEGEGRPTLSLNGTASTPTLSPQPDGLGTSATN